MQEVDVSGDITGFKEIRVVVVPIGNISERKFSEYLALIKNFSCIELANVTPREPKGGGSGAFVNQSWKDGRVFLRFVDARACHRSDWEDFQVHRKTLGVVGVLHCAGFGHDLSEAYVEFERVRRLHPTAVAVTCFAFEPRDDQPDFAKDNLVMIPNHGGDQKHLLFYINTLLLDFTATIIQELEKMFEAEQAWASAYISTPLDPHNPSADEVNRLKKRKSGRVSKIKGDYCLLAGDPRDALTFYQVAAESARQNSDLVWLAGALEGECAALILLEQGRNGSIVDLPAVVEKYNDVLSLYNKSHAVILELEGSLRLAGYHTEAKRRLAAADLLMRAHALSAEFSTQERILVCTAIAGFCRKLGFLRKYAFFLREAAALYHKIFMLSTAHSLFLQVAPYYDLPSLLPSSAELHKGPSWVYLQRGVLQGLISTSRALNDATALAAYTVSLLRTHQGDTENAEEQVQLATELARVSKYVPASAQIDMQAAFPHLLAISLSTSCSGGAAVRVGNVSGGESSGDGDSPFIFTPIKFQKTKRGLAGSPPPVTWIAHHDANITLYLRNPFAFQIFLESVSVSVSGVPFECVPALGVALPANTSCHEVTLTGRALGAGELKIEGALIHVFSTVTMHRVDQRGHGPVATPPFKQNQLTTNTTASVFTNHVTVLPVLPLVHVSTHLNPHHFCLPNQTRWSVGLNIWNSGSVPVETLKVRLVEAALKPWQISARRNNDDDNLTTDNGQPQPVSWHEDEIARQLPLAPSRRMHLTLHVDMARLGARSPQSCGIVGKLMLVYSGGEGLKEGWAREAIVEASLGTAAEVPPQIEPLPPQLQAANVLPYAPLQNGSYPRAPQDMPTIAMADLSEGTLHGNEEEVLAALAETRALLVLQLNNSSSLGFTVLARSILPDEPRPKMIQTSCPPKSSQKLVVPVARLEAGDIVRDIVAACKQHLLRHLSLQWISGWGHAGDIDLGGLNVSAAMASRLLVDAVSIRLSWLPHTDVNSTDQTDSRAHAQQFDHNMNVRVGVFGRLRVEVTNRSSSPLGLRLRILPYQDMHNGAHRISLLHKMLWIGSLHPTMPALEPQQTVEHEVLLSVLQAGVYNLHASCTNLQTNDVFWTHKPLQLHAAG